MLHPMMGRLQMIRINETTPQNPKHFDILYVASLLILWRSVYRLAEYIQDSDGSLQMHEVYVYVFDALLMFITCIVFNIWHPSTTISHKSEAVPQEDMEFSS
ncbi:RTA1 like protein-domain-containing protein [Phyllosticta paracitricarpa]|uniref:RTA1 like protein-domain-containing protein n=1 Tax=Phyllosticta paracitricarpa TaxID=2016321 RepID=A0ABR1MUR2_9PEZI